MNFFESQDQARRKTRYLVFLFFCAVMGLILITNLLVFTAQIFFKDDTSHSQLINKSGKNHTNHTAHSNPHAYLNAIDWRMFWFISVSIVVIIAAASLYKLLSLTGGGKSVALGLGGRPLSPDSNDPDERKLLNVVEEMALAAGMPVPTVYLLSEEDGINAFAAGYALPDAVIGITRGCMMALNREQLQGVIGHEFSHILNGDMRLNIRLVAILHGILFIGLIGRSLLGGASRSYGRGAFRAHGRSSKDDKTIPIGIALMVIGFAGYFFGGLIKAAVSRQREFLADAAAVQFTRNPSAIAGALKVIGAHGKGSIIHHTRAKEMSHFFFSSPTINFADLVSGAEPSVKPAIEKSHLNQGKGHAQSPFDTHPRIEDRIKRIEPSWDGQYPAVKAAQSTNALAPDRQHKMTAAIALAVATSQAIDQVEPEQINISKGQDIWTSISDQIKVFARDPKTAPVLIYSLLLAKNQTQRNTQVALIKKYHPLEGNLTNLETVLAASAQIPQDQRLNIIDLCMPALKTFAEPQYKPFMQIIKRLVQADNTIAVDEWCLYTLLRHYLGSSFEKRPNHKPIYKTMKAISPQLQILISMVAWSGENKKEDAVKGFTRAANSLTLYNLTLLEKDQLPINQFDKVTRDLGRCYPLIKPRILKAIVLCIEHDGIVTATELELLHAISAIMDCPLPPLSKEGATE